MNSPIIFGIDPGFASFGWGAMTLGEHAKNDELESLGLISTEKSQKKREVRASDDAVDRGRQIAKELHVLIDFYRPIAVCAEAQSWPRNASATAKVGIAWGVIIGELARWSLPLLQASPQEIKRSLTGKKDASKLDVQKALRKRSSLWNEKLDNVLSRLPKAKHEHPVDAVASIVACLETDLIRLARLRERTREAS